MDTLKLPNLLTLARMILTPAIVWAILFGHGALAFGFFVIAASTDVLDGWTARRFELTTKMGALLDPIADKFLIGVTFLALAIVHVVPWWFFIIVIARDVFILMSVSILWVFTPIHEFPPSRLGKASTFFQILAVVVFMAMTSDIFWLSPLFNVVAIVVLWASVVFTVVSGLHYLWIGFRRLRNLFVPLRTS